MYDQITRTKCNIYIFLSLKASQMSCVVVILDNVTFQLLKMF